MRCDHFGINTRIYMLNERIKSFVLRFITNFVIIRKLNHAGSKNTFLPKRLINGENITMGSRNRFEWGLRIECTKKYKGKEYNGKIVIGDSNTFNQNIHITSSGLIKIGDQNIFGPNCVITATKHNLLQKEDKLIPGTTIIGNNNFIGANTVVCPGAKIGDNCTIGPNKTIFGEVSNNSKIL